jgi:hypothetical protein
VPRIARKEKSFGRKAAFAPKPEPKEEPKEASFLF